MGSSFEEHIVRISAVKVDRNFDVSFKNYGFSKKIKSELNAFTHVRVCAFAILVKHVV